MAVLHQPMDRETLHAFQAQLEAPGFLESMEKFARKKSWRVSKARGYDDPDYATNLVEDVIGDVFRGVISWCPLKSPLEETVVAAIHWRAERDVRQARRFTVNQDLDETPANDVDELAERIDLRTAFVEAMLLARQHAGDDRDVIALIAAREEGATNRSEIMMMSGLTSLAYDAARKRFGRVLLKLPQQLRNALRSR